MKSVSFVLAMVEHLWPKQIHELKSKEKPTHEQTSLAFSKHFRCCNDTITKQLNFDTLNQMVTMPYEVHLLINEHSIVHVGRPSPELMSFRIIIQL